MAERLQLPAAPMQNDSQAQLRWLNEVVQVFEQAGGHGLPQVAGYIKGLEAQLAERPLSDKELAKVAREASATLQALGIHSLIQEMAGVYGELLRQAEAQPPGSAGRTKLEEAAARYEGVLDRMTDAYEELRRGNPASLEALPRDLKAIVSKRA